jgi:large subunit ribosomal protein L4
MVGEMNVYDIINYTSFIITRDAVNRIEEVYS